MCVLDVNNFLQQCTIITVHVGHLGVFRIGLSCVCQMIFLSVSCLQLATLPSVKLMPCESMIEACMHSSLASRVTSSSRAGKVFFIFS